MPDYVLRGVPDCLKRDAWWLSAEDGCRREEGETAKRGSAAPDSGLSSGTTLPESGK